VQVESAAHALPRLYKQRASLYPARLAGTGSAHTLARQDEPSDRVSSRTLALLPRVTRQNDTLYIGLHDL
jgi:hypothetical protein